MGVSVQVLPQTQTPKHLFKYAEYIITRFLVGLALSGRRRMLKAIYEYVVANGSLSRVTRENDVSKNTLRHIITRLWHGSGLPYPEYHVLLENVLKTRYLELLLIKPIVIDGYCVLCKKRVDKGHVWNKHRHLLAQKTMELLGWEQ